MIITNVSIQGFGPFYQEANVAWNELGKIVAVVAPNGSGKTFLMEAPFACLYGFFPCRDHVIESVSQGGDGIAHIKVAFLHKGIRYTALRELTPSTHKATLWRANEKIAGPKVRDFDAAVTELFGDSSTALATRQAAQGTIGDLTTCKPAERRAIMAELLAFKELQAIADKAKDKAREANGRAAGLMHHATMAETFRKNIEDAERILAGHEAEAASLEIDLSARRAQHANLIAKAEEWKKRISERNRLSTAVEDAKKAAASRKELLDSTVARIADMMAQANQLSVCTAAAAVAKSLETDLHQLMDRKEAYDRWVKAEQEAQRADDRHESLVAQLAGVRAAVEAPSDEERALAFKLPDAMEQYRLRKADILAVQARNQEVVDERRRIESEIKAMQASKERLTAKAAKRPSTPADAETCSRCPLMKEWAGIAEEISQIDTDIHIATSRLQLTPVLEPVPSLDDAVAYGQKCRAAQDKLAAYNKHVENTAALAKQVEDAEAIARHTRANVPLPCEDPSDLIDDLKTKLADQRAIASGLDRALMAQQTVVELREKRGEHEARLADANKALEDAIAALNLWDDAHFSMDGPPEKSAIDFAASTVRQTETSLETIKRRVATVAGEIEGTRKALASSEEGVALYNEARDEAADMAVIAQAFGPKGIQALLIDRAAPALEAIAAAMLDQVTGGNMRLRIATQRANTDGSIAEDFSIMVEDAIGERDVRTYSGGERNLLRLTLRLALCLWLARISGYSVESLAIDEAFDALDAENATNVLQLVTGMSGDFSQVVVVTHNPALAEMVPSRITLDKGPLGTRVEVAT